ELAEDAAGFAEVENAELASGAQHAMEFAQARFVVGEIAEAEGGGDEVERIIRKRQMEGVGLDGDSIVVAELLRAACQHGVGEIGCENGLRGLGVMVEQAPSNVSDAAAVHDTRRL